MEQIQMISVDQLHLDKENPRLPERLRSGDTTEREVLNWMLSDATLVDLMASISENGFFSGEPIIGIEEGSNIIIVEGNRRLGAVKLLQNPGLANVSPITVRKISDDARNSGNLPQELPVYICSKRSDISNYLGFRHVTGVKPWPLISKARYLDGLYRQIVERRGTADINVYKELAKEIGSKASYVRRLLLSFHAYQKISSKNFYFIEGLDESNLDLSLLGDSITRYSGIADYMGVDIENENAFQRIDEKKFEQVVRWLYERKSDGRTALGEGRNLKLLNRILQYEEARSSFESGELPLQKAAELTDLADENIRTYLNTSYESLKAAQSLIHLFQKPESEDTSLLEDLLASAEVISGVIRKKIRASHLDPKN